MSNSKEVEVKSTGLALQATAQMPTGGAIVAGWSMQGGVDALTKVSREDFKQGLRERIEEDTADLRVATVALKEARDALTAAIEAIATPEELFEAMDQIAALMLPYHPGAKTVRLDRNNKPYRQIDTNLVKGTLTAHVSIYDGRETLYGASKEYQLPPAVVTLNAAVNAAVTVEAECRATLADDSRAMANVDEVVDTIEAELTRAQLMATDEGKAVLDSQKKGVDRAFAALDKKRNKGKKK